MGRATRLYLEPGERRVVVIRRHWWTLARPALWAALVLVGLPCYALVEYLAPSLDLARFSLTFLDADLVLLALLALKWLAVDLLPWLGERYIVTNRRVVECRGVLQVERREVPVRGIQETNYAISGTQARFFDFGDLQVQGAGRGKELVFHAVPRPRQIQTLLAREAQEAREAYQRLQPKDNEINAALSRVFSIPASGHDRPTQYVPVLSRAALRAQRRLNLLREETVVLAARPHPLLLAQALFAPLALGGMALTLAVAARGMLPSALLAPLTVGLTIWLAWTVFDWAADQYVLTTERLIWLRRTPLLAETRSVAQVRAVEDVVLRIHTLSGRLFDLGTVTVHLSGDDLVLVGVPQPERWQRSIFEQQEAALRLDRVRDQERLAGTLGEWFKEYHRMQQGAP